MALWLTSGGAALCAPVGTLPIRKEKGLHVMERRTKMFGQMQVTRMFQLSKLETVDEALA